MVDRKDIYLKDWVGGRRVEVRRVEAIVSGRLGGCCEVRDDVKNIMGGGFGGVDDHFCEPKGQWIERIG